MIQFDPWSIKDEQWVYDMLMFADEVEINDGDQSYDGFAWLLSIGREEIHIDAVDYHNDI